MVSQAYYQDLAKARDDGKLNERVGNLFMRASRAKQQFARQFERNQTNWRYYLALDPEYGLGQYTLKHIAWMKAQGRAISTYNICKSYIDQIAGGIMQSPFDPEFYPVNDSMSSLTEAAKNAMYVDKELTDWSTAYFELVRGSLIHQAVLKMGVTDKYHPLGNINLRYVLPMQWYPDPMWVTIHTKDCRICWEEFYLMPDDLMEEYEGRMEAQSECKHSLKELISQYRNGRLLEYGPQGGPTPFVGDDQTWGSALKCLAEYRMVRQNQKVLVYESPNGDVEIPNGLQDDKARIEWLHERFGFEQWDPYSIKEYEEKRLCCMKEVICPSLTWSELLDSSPTEVQIDQIPFFVSSADRVNGEPHGIIDLIKDPQDDINSGNALIKYKMQVEGGGGGQFADPEGFASREEFDEYVKYRNDPSKTWETAPGLMIRSGKTPAQAIVTSQFPVEAYKHIEHIIGTMLPQISKVVPASRGQAESSQESGYAFNLKKIQADQALYTIHYMQRQFWNQVYEGYLLQAAQQYSLGGVERRFSSQGGKKTAVFNERIQLPDGSIGIRNEAAKLREIRHKVIISETQDTPTKRIEDMRLLTDYLNGIIKIAAQKPVTISYIATRMANLIDPLSKEDKDAIAEIGAEEIEVGLMQLKVNKLQLQQQLTQLESAIAMPAMPAQPQAEAAGAPQAPQEDGGVPINQAPQAQGVTL